MKHDIVLIITSSIDYTVDYLIDKYKNIKFYRLNVDMIDCYEIFIYNQGWSIDSETGRVSNQNIKSIYYRKPVIPNLSEFSTQYHRMITDDIIAVVNGIAESFQGTVISRPSILRKCENKIFQLQILSQCGICFPVSCIGNKCNMDEQIKSVEKIIKPLTHGKIDCGKYFEIFQTNPLVTNVGNISKTPVYIQEKVDKDYEVRITCVDNHIWTVRIDTSEEIDWRRCTASNVYTLIPTPPHIQSLCIKVLSLFELKFGAFDFIVRPDGKWIFLEINPNGQWLWLELELNLDISSHLINFLNK